VVRIAISVEAFEAIARTMPVGTVGFDNATNERGKRLIWLPPAVVDRCASCTVPARATAMSSCGLRAGRRSMTIIRRETRAGTKVTPEQFEISEDKVTHIPTGAWFIAFPGRPEIANRNWGRAGDRLNGDEYRRADILAMAQQLLRARKQARS
jgi:hypothetical protein